jgi:hypothetical protein
MGQKIKGIASPYVMSMKTQIFVRRYGRNGWKSYKELSKGSRGSTAQGGFISLLIIGSLY